MTEQTPKVKPPAGFLARALARKRREVETGRRVRPLNELAMEARDRAPARPWAATLRAPGAAVIAEVKRASPSAGSLAPDLDAAGRARLFERNGAAAISVLTDAAFDGRLDDLRAVADAVTIPVLRKDFLVDPWQVWESRAAGADAALVIVAALDDEGLAGLVEAAGEAGLGLLVEIHVSEESSRAVALDADVIGVNARDLASLDVDVAAGLDLLRRLRGEAPDAVLVAESGITGPDDVRRARRAGADAVLVGEHLARAADAGAALAALVDADQDDA